MPKGYNRIINLNAVLSRKSCFLLGPRQTGKSWIIRNQFRDARVYNLLEVDTYRALGRRPALLREENVDPATLVVIDEIQLLPELLNEVHLLIEERNMRFLLTGSSARKLRKQGVNLLGGRATWKSLLPLVKQELGSDFELHKALGRGTIPSIYNSDSFREDLNDYVEVYLREEIASETAIRQLSVYSRFLDTAALCNAGIVNYTEIGNDSQISPTTVREYFYVLRDTLMIHRLPAWRESKRRKAFAKDKFYFFDIGVARHLQGRSELAEGTDDFGQALESYVFHELNAYSSYISSEPLFFWRTSSFEVDFLIADHTAVEVKATRSVSDRHLKGLLALKEEGSFRNYVLASMDTRERVMKGCRIMPVTTFLDRLWAGEFR